MWYQPSGVKLCTYIIGHSHSQTSNCRNKKKNTFLTEEENVWLVCIYVSLIRIIPPWRTEGDSLSADDPRPRVAVYHPVVCVRLWLHVVQRPPVPLLLFILSALMRRESLSDHWKSLRISWCVAQRHTRPLRWMNVHLQQWRDLTGNKKKKPRRQEHTHRLQTPIQDETGHRHS